MNELEREIVERIAASGPITFCEFMRLALYHPEFGYYSKPVRIGKAGGDFYTNAEVHSLFGAVLADAIVRYLNELPSNDRKTIVEYGAGNGKLAFDILTALNADHASLAQSIDYVIVEQNSLAVQYQRQLLTEFPQVKWATTEKLVTDQIIGVVLSNELIDAFPVHRVRFHEGELQEQFVGCEDQRLVSAWLEPSSIDLGQYIKDNKIELIPDQIIETNLVARRWLKQVSETIAAGFVITIDYGDIARRLYSPKRMQGSLRCFSSHKLTDDPFLNVGQRDITASVNFTDLITYGSLVGFESPELTNQSEWLIRNGIIPRAEKLERVLRDREDSVAIIECRQALKDLLVPGGISDNFRVLVQQKNAMFFD